MIHRVSSSWPSFKELELAPGLNVIVGARQSKSQKDTRNSVGKTTLIKIIDFCFGSNIDSDFLNNDERFKKHSFTIEITLIKNKIKATRRLSEPNKIYIEGDTSDWTKKPEVDDKNNKYISLKNWKILLGSTLFSIKNDDVPFRNLINYFIRHGKDSYRDPLNIIPQRKKATLNMNILLTFLIGLDYRIAKRWKEIKDRINELEQIKKTITHIIKSKGELRTEIVNTNTALQEKKITLAEFKVDREYADRQKEADALTKELHKLQRSMIIHNNKLQSYLKAVKQETSPDIEELKSIYEEVKFFFPDKIKKHLAAANKFHEDIIKNRAEFLKSEIQELQTQLKKTNQSITEKDIRRAKVVNILDTHGALEEFSALQEDVSKLEGKLARLSHDQNEWIKVDRELEELADEKEKLYLNAKLDYKDNELLCTEAIKLFNENSNVLYEKKREGKFIIDVDNNKDGYKFKSLIEGGKGSGINKMNIFCYDLMNICLQKKQDRIIGLLIHDSTIYEGVDERQVALAIEQAKRKADKYNFQYIMTINSDTVPTHDFSESFDFKKYIKLELSDKDPAKSLMGTKF